MSSIEAADVSSEALKTISYFAKLSTSLELVYDFFGKMKLPCTGNAIAALNLNVIDGNSSNNSNNSNGNDRGFQCQCEAARSNLFEFPLDILGGLCILDPETYTIKRFDPAVMDDGSTMSSNYGKDNNMNTFRFVIEGYSSKTKANQRKKKLSIRLCQLFGLSKSTDLGSSLATASNFDGFCGNCLKLPEYLSFKDKIKLFWIEKEKEINEVMDKVCGGGSALSTGFDSASGASDLMINNRLLSDLKDGDKSSLKTCRSIIRSYDSLKESSDCPVKVKNSRVLHVHTVPERHPKFSFRCNDSFFNYSGVMTSAQEISTIEAIPNINPLISAAVNKLGLRLYSHQIESITRFINSQGSHLAISTGTGSGKTLIVLIILFQTILNSNINRNKVMLVYPTKALAQDQLRSISTFCSLINELISEQLQMDNSSGITNIRRISCLVCDGDSNASDRARVMSGEVDIVITNPDMLNITLLPKHAECHDLWTAMGLLVVDEGHYYKGNFGAHVSAVFRRLVRIASYHRDLDSGYHVDYSSNSNNNNCNNNSSNNSCQSMRFICLSATIANPREHMKKLFPIDASDSKGHYDINNDSNNNSKSNNSSITSNIIVIDRSSDGSSSPERVFIVMDSNEAVNCSSHHPNMNAAPTDIKLDGQLVIDRSNLQEQVIQNFSAFLDEYLSKYHNRKLFLNKESSFSINSQSIEQEEIDLDEVSSSNLVPKDNNRFGLVDHSDAIELMKEKLKLALFLKGCRDKLRSYFDDVVELPATIQSSESSGTTALSLKPLPQPLMQVEQQSINGKNESHNLELHSGSGKKQKRKNDESQLKSNGISSNNINNNSNSDSSSVQRGGNNALEASRLLAILVNQQLRTISFCKSRRFMELVVGCTQDMVANASNELASTEELEVRRPVVMGYRGGYTAQSRRDIEKSLFARPNSEIGVGSAYDGSDGGGSEGSLMTPVMGIVSTSALEVGVDLSGLQAVVCNGAPRSYSALWQQSGRAGRDSHSSATCVVLLFDSAADLHLKSNPVTLFDKTRGNRNNSVVNSNKKSDKEMSLISSKVCMNCFMNSAHDVDFLLRRGPKSSDQTTYCDLCENLNKAARSTETSCRKRKNIDGIATLTNETEGNLIPIGAADTSNDINDSCLHRDYLNDRRNYVTLSSGPHTSLPLEPMSLDCNNHAVLKQHLVCAIAELPFVYRIDCASADQSSNLGSGNCSLDSVLWDVKVVNDVLDELIQQNYVYLNSKSGITQVMLNKSKIGMYEWVGKRNDDGTNELQCSSNRNSHSHNNSHSNNNSSNGHHRMPQRVSSSLPTSPAATVNLRKIDPVSISIVEERQPDVEVDSVSLARALSDFFEGAIYINTSIIRSSNSNSNSNSSSRNRVGSSVSANSQYIVTKLDLRNRKAIIRPSRVPYYTMSSSCTTIGTLSVYRTNNCIVLHSMAISSVGKTDSYMMNDDSSHQMNSKFSQYTKDNRVGASIVSPFTTASCQKNDFIHMLTGDKYAISNNDSLMSLATTSYSIGRLKISTKITGYTKIPLYRGKTSSIVGVMEQNEGPDNVYSGDRAENKVMRDSYDILIDDQMLPNIDYETTGFWIVVQPFIVELLSSLALDIPSTLHACNHALAQAVSVIFQLDQSNDINCQHSYPSNIRLQRDDPAIVNNAIPDSKQIRLIIFGSESGEAIDFHAVFESRIQIVERAIELLEGCDCSFVSTNFCGISNGRGRDSGCIRCVLSQHCPEGGKLLSKQGALVLLKALLATSVETSTKSSKNDTPN